MTGDTNSRSDVFVHDRQIDPNSDGDGLTDSEEAALGTNPNNPDSDGDGLTDGFEVNLAGTNPLAADSDDDDLNDGDDSAPLDPDRDADGVLDGADNYPNHDNPAQEDDDNDGLGNACEDTDADGVLDVSDNCPLEANAGQADTDDDGQGDVCDPDDDGDGVADVDEPGLGADPLDPDSDGDGVNDGFDNCVLLSNPDQTDTDEDGLGNACDTAIYLIDNTKSHQGAVIYQVELDTGQNIANLKPVTSIPYNRAHIAVSLDGRRIYAAQNGPVRLGYYDLVEQSFTDLGPLVANHAIQAAFSTDGVLYIGNSANNKIYTVDIDTLEVTEIGRAYKPNEKKMNINGADLVFTPYSTMYLMTRKGGNKIYEVPAAGSTDLMAVRVLDGPGHQATGLAFDPEDPNLLLFSEQHLDKIIVIDRTSAGVVGQLNMRLNGLPFNHKTGDMSVWPVTDESP